VATRAVKSRGDPYFQLEPDLALPLLYILALEQMTSQMSQSRQAPIDISYYYYSLRAMLKAIGGGRRVWPASVKWV
jgi:hypothetical protein